MISEISYLPCRGLECLKIANCTRLSVLFDVSEWVRLPLASAIFLLVAHSRQPGSLPKAIRETQKLACTDLRVPLSNELFPFEKPSDCDRPAQPESALTQHGP